LYAYLLIGAGMKKGLNIDAILLTRSELRIMKVIWDEGVATVKDVCSALSPKRTIAYTTVLTFMKILEEKGALVHTRSGRAFVYTPILTREQAIRNHMRDSIERYFDGCPEKLLADVLNNEVISREQLGSALHILDAWRENEVA
jgi:predicted transcriptional regulator